MKMPTQEEVDDYIERLQADGILDLDDGDNDLDGGDGDDGPDVGGNDPTDNGNVGAILLNDTNNPNACKVCIQRPQTVCLLPRKHVRLCQPCA